mmetsp:Transcript_17742/g.38013  ORF Transcript_17742/g.38013 Transcript_17742/m.38013 type:complete len:239 (+) Transcript_17742:85-801(+)
MAYELEHVVGFARETIPPVHQSLQRTTYLVVLIFERTGHAVKWSRKYLLAFWTEMSSHIRRLRGHENLGRRCERKYFSISGRNPTLDADRNFGDISDQTVEARGDTCRRRWERDHWLRLAKANCRYPGPTRHFEGLWMAFVVINNDLKGSNVGNLVFRSQGRELQHYEMELVGRYNAVLGPDSKWHGIRQASSCCIRLRGINRRQEPVRDRGVARICEHGDLVRPLPRETGTKTNLTF